MHRSFRWLHRWGSLLIAIPLLVVISTGILLQVKKQVTWVQPPTARGSEGEPQLSWDALLEVARSVPEAEVSSWDDVDRLDVRIGKSVAKVRCENRWEIQIDLVTGEVLQSTYRRSDIIEAMHDGSWFAGDAAKLGVFLPNGLVLLGLWATGMYLFFMPILKKRKNRKARTQRTASN
jgi:uncharacterized iron-regulated membrane protein